MAAMYGVGVTLVPDKPDEVEENDHYDAVFALSGARYCFATLGYPHELVQRSRGVWADFTGVPEMETASTSLRTEKLMPDSDETIVSLFFQQADSWESTVEK